MRARVGKGNFTVDGTRFPQCNTGIGIFDGRDTTIGVDIDEGLLLDVAKVNELGFVGQAKLFQHDSRLPGICTEVSQRLR